jgi:hypothetical protein
MVLRPAGLGTKNDCVGEGHQKFTPPIYRRIIIGERVSTEVTLNIRIREVLGYNFSQDTIYPD